MPAPARDDRVRARAGARGLLAAIVVAGGACLAGAAGAGAGRAALLATADDEVVARTTLPHAVGEVRIVRRGAAAVVQTRLRTILLGDATAEIREKELANWPVGTPGAEPATRFARALAVVGERLEDRPRPADPGADRRHSLLIEFVAAPDGELVAIGEYAIGGRDPARLVRLEPVTLLELDRDYVRRNMRLIVAGSFSASPVQVERLLAPFPWLGAAPVPAPRPSAAD
jgi:hypothetical protein